MQSSRDMKRSAYAVPIGLLSFAALVYVGFIRNETVDRQDVKSTEHAQTEDTFITPPSP